MAVLLKTASVQVSSIQIMQVGVQNKGKSVWKSRYVGDVSTFPNTFALVLDSNLHDLNGTNLGLTLFSAELPWCYFCPEI